MRFQVPQFIEVESKIFGPLTLKQFIYLAGGAGIIFLLYVILPFFLMFLFTIPVGALALALAFYKPNNRPFIKMVENALHYASDAKIYIWKKKEKKD
ncbi:MAG TPA: PrgI family protein, partial [bacterium]|nr:PrgI family protein [bacterium]